MPRYCDACETAPAHIGYGGAMVCRRCDVEVKAEMERLRREGKPVNVVHIARGLFREANPDAESYLLRDIPQELWHRVKMRATAEGISIRDMLLQALRSYIA